jgi:hypothetical protein
MILLWRILLLVVMLCLIYPGDKLKLSAAVPANEPNAPQAVSTAATEGDPIVSIGRKMSDLATLLSKASSTTDPHVGKLQRQIIEQLDALLKQLEDQSQGQASSSSASGGGGRQQDTRTQIGSGTPEATGPQTAGKGEPKEGDSRESSQRLGQATPKINLAELLQVVKQVWGHLPEKERERLRQLSGDQVLPGHDVAVEKYFRRLADESQREESKP